MNLYLKKIVNNELIHVTALESVPRIGENLTFQDITYTVKKVNHIYSIVNRIEVHLYEDLI